MYVMRKLLTSTANLTISTLAIVVAIRILVLENPTLGQLGLIIAAASVVTLLLCVLSRIL